MVSVHIKIKERKDLNMFDQSKFFSLWNERRHNFLNNFEFKLH